MRISSYCGGFTLYEVMISIPVEGIILGLTTGSLLPLFDRSEFFNTTNHFKDTLRHAKWLAHTKRKSHRFYSDTGFLMLQEKIAASYQKVSQEKVPEEISVITNRRPSFSFSASSLATRVSIIIENEDYSTKVVGQPDSSYSPDCS